MYGLQSDFPENNSTISLKRGQCLWRNKDKGIACRLLHCVVMGRLVDSRCLRTIRANSKLAKYTSRSFMERDRGQYNVEVSTLDVVANTSQHLCSPVR